MRVLIACLLALLAAACGQTGPLLLPDEPPASPTDRDEDEDKK